MTAASNALAALALTTLAFGVIFNTILPRWRRILRALLLDDDP